MLFRCVLLILSMLLPACNLSKPTLSPTDTVSATLESPTEPVISPTETPSDETEIPTERWLTIEDGLEMRTYIPNDAEISQLTVIRIDPTKYHFRAVYRAGDPLNIVDWQVAEPEAHVIINSNFFTAENQVLGLLVSDGQVSGNAYTDRGGTFLVQNGILSMRGNIAYPYQGEPLEQAIQGFPMLVENGQATFFNTSGDKRTRRTVIAQDSDGQILLMATPYFGITLADLSAYLPTTDMNIVTAFNLDGGGSTMMAATDADYVLHSFDPVPAVLAVYRR